MKTFEIIIYDWDKEIEYERCIIKCNTYAEMMKFANRHCQELMVKYDLQEIYWNYTEVI